MTKLVTNFKTYYKAKDTYKIVGVFLLCLKIKGRVLIMATKSVDNILYQCTKCQRHRVIKNGIDGNRCNYCEGYLSAVCFTNLSTSKDYKESTSIGKLQVDIDCSDALTGLKAVQREARKATASLKEFEQAYNKTKSIADECNVNSQELLAILAKSRGGLS